ncbi:DUF881 domain-containing protein [Knoellia subterranea]|uniref:Membrane protein n=1 Tax=Knoellia subterranea KCTC 19937 TaxID=1385521 RepID=A0A0A0JPF0_9MICO|nr:DUF881 domain-containing protein [Knoellia subterranea]KGN38634.1 membrane protein [Knoellia subterranea KCTC 19937]
MSRRKQKRKGAARRPNPPRQVAPSQPSPVEESASEEIASKEAAVDEQPVEDAAEEVTADEPSGDGAQIDDAAVEEPSVEDVEDVAAEEQPAEDEAAVETPVEDSPSEDTVVEEQAVDDAAAEEIPDEDVPSDGAVLEDSPVEDAAEEDRAAVEAPDVDVPSEDAAVDEQPAEDAAEEVAADETSDEDAPADGPELEDAAADDAPNSEAVAEEAGAEATEQPIEDAVVEEPLDEGPLDEDKQTGEASAPAAAVPSSEPSRTAWSRLGRAGRPRPTKANVLATLLALGLGFAIAAQVHQTSIEGLEDLREDELIRILDTVDQDGNRLAEEIQTLQFSRDRLQSDTTSLTEAQQAAQQRLDSLGIMAGTVPAKGPGIVLTIRDPEHGVTAPILLDTLQELRDAGAEAVEINDIRVVANTYFTDGEGGIAISGKDVSPPYVISVIGDGSTLASAMEIPGGVANTVRSVGGQAGIEIKSEVTVSALQSVSEPQYARPVPSPTKS